MVSSVRNLPAIDTAVVPRVTVSVRARLLNVPLTTFWLPASVSELWLLIVPVLPEDWSGISVKRWTGVMNVPAALTSSHWNVKFGTNDVLLSTTVGPDGEHAASMPTARMLTACPRQTAMHRLVVIWSPLSGVGDSASVTAGPTDAGS